jgi:hypothetical protein
VLGSEAGVRGWWSLVVFLSFLSSSGGEADFIASVALVLAEAAGVVRG